MTGEQTKKVIDRIKEIIHKGHEEFDGYCRVGYAITDVVKEIKNPRLADITKITAYMINTGEYTMYPSKYNEKDVDIFPVNKLDFFYKKSHKRTFYILFAIAFISSGLSVFKFVQDQFQEEEKVLLEKRVQLLEEEISKQHTYILPQKDVDSLLNANLNKHD